MNIAEATQRINDTLRSLEMSTGSVVESIELRDIDVTTVDSGEQQLVRSVAIEMKRLPVKIALDIQGQLGTCGNCDREYSIHPMVHVATMPMYLTPHTEEYTQVNHDDHWSAAGKTVPARPKTWDLWLEGFQIQGASEKARCYARNLPGDSFKDAVIKFAETPQAKGLGLFDEERLSFWGCRVFDNEEDARRSYG